MTEEDFKLIEDNLKSALIYEKDLNQQLMGRLDGYESIIKTMKDGERTMNTMSDNRPISDTACNTATNEMPTIGAFVHETISMQMDTLSMMDTIANVMWGDEPKAPAFVPKENIMAGLAAIRENQKAIMTAVKAIVDKL